MEIDAGKMKRQIILVNIDKYKIYFEGCMAFLPSNDFLIL